MEMLTLLLSIVGASAWIPIIITPIIKSLRKVQANLLDFRVLTNGKGISVGKQKEKSGTIILMAINLFTKGIDYFPTHICAKVKLNSGTISNAELLDFSTIVSNNDNKTQSRYDVPINMEFNVSRTIQKNSDNIKCVSFLVEDASFTELSDIREIKIILHSGRIGKKTIKIHSSQFPVFNSTHILEKYEKEASNS